MSEPTNLQDELGLAEAKYADLLKVRENYQQNIARVVEEALRLEGEIRALRRMIERAASGEKEQVN